VAGLPVSATSAPLPANIPHQLSVSQRFRQDFAKHIVTMQRMGIYPETSGCLKLAHGPGWKIQTAGRRDWRKENQVGVRWIYSHVTQWPQVHTTCHAFTYQDLLLNCGLAQQNWVLKKATMVDLPDKQFVKSFVRLFKLC